MQQALHQAALAAQEGEVPVGAALVSADNRLLAVGYNQPISGCDPTAHAEVVAIRNACRQVENYRLPGATLYVTLEPCTLCFGAMVHARVGRLVYGATEPRAGVCESQLQLPEQAFYNHRLEVNGGLMAADSAALLKQFFADRR